MAVVLDEAYIDFIAGAYFDTVSLIRQYKNVILIQTNIEGERVEEIFLQNAIMIRNAAEFGLNGWIRVSVRTFEENKKVVKVLEQIAKMKER